MTKSVGRNAGNGDETHQTTDADHPVLPTNHGGPISDNQNQPKVGPRCPVLLEDEVYREKINHFDHERIPERIGQPSVTVDACAVVLSKEAAAKLTKEVAVVQWVMDAFGHLKAIGHNAAAKPLLDKGRRAGRGRRRSRRLRRSCEEALLGPGTERPHARLRKGAGDRGGLVAVASVESAH